MSLYFLFSNAILYVAEKIREKLAEKIGDYVVEKIGEFVVAPIERYVVAPIERYLVAPIREIGHKLRFWLYNRSIENFRKKFENLRNVEAMVLGLVNAAPNDEVILPNVQKWQASVDEIIKEWSKFFDEKEVGGNLNSLHQRSRNAKKKTAVIDELIREGNGFNRVSTFGVVFQSRRLVFEKIMEALEDDGINMIAICGMVGVGKTALAEEVSRRATVDSLFDVVKKVTEVSQTRSEIAEKLDQMFEEKGELGGATKRVLLILDDIRERVDLPKGCKVVLTSRRRDVCDQMDTKSGKNFLIEVLSEQEGWDLFQKMAGGFVDSPDLRDLAFDVAKRCGGLPLAIVKVAEKLKGQKELSDWRDTCDQLLQSITPSEEVFPNLKLSYNGLESEEAKDLFVLCSLFPEDRNIDIQDLMRYGMGLGWFQDVKTVDDARNRAHELANKLKSSCLLLDSDDKEHVKMHKVVRGFALSIASKEKHVFLVRDSPSWKKRNNHTSKRYNAMSLDSDSICELPDELEYSDLQILFLKYRHPSLQFPDNFFLRMKNIKVLDMYGMDFSSLPSSLCSLKNLRMLALDFCSLEDISMIGELRSLEILSFRGSDIKQLPKEIGMLTQLRLLDLTDCEELTIIPRDVILGLSKLEGLYMAGSFHEWEIERQDEERSNASLVEQKQLSCLINLEIEISDASLLPVELDFENLSRFKISIGTSSGLMDQFSYSKILKLELNLSTGLKDGVKSLLKKADHLHLVKIKGLKSVLYDLDIKRFQNLRSLNVEQCSEVEDIFNASEWVSSMEKLELVDLEKLTGIFFLISKLTGIFFLISKLTGIFRGQLPIWFSCKLQELRLSKLPRLVNLWKDQAQYVCFHNLRVVQVEHCNGLKNLFSLSMARDLSKLVELKVSNCEIMEEIIGNEKEAATAAPMDDIVFPHLRSLEVQELPKLRNFCFKKNCLAMKWHLDTLIEKHLFDKKVAFPALERLIFIGDLHSFNFPEIWHPQLPVKSFSQLKVLKVVGCCKVRNVVPFNLLQRLRSLEELIVEHCDLVEELVKVKGDLIGMLPQLRLLQLWELPKLKHIWCDKYLYGTLGFRNLSSINIKMCHSLKSLCSPSIASNLVQLQKIEIVSCVMVETIIGREREGEENCIEIIEFPQLHTLILKNLPKFISSRFPIQQKLMTKVAAQEGNLHDPLYPLFDKQVAFTNLVDLRIINIENLQEIFRSDLPDRSFSQLRILQVEKCGKLLRVALSNLLPRLKYLEELIVKDCKSLEEIFKPEGPVGKRTTIPLSCLKKVELHDLPELRNFCAGNFNFELPLLETLSLVKCPKMQTFSSGFISTPRLDKICGEQYEEPLKCDLNSTVQHLFSKMLEGDIPSERVDEEDEHKDKDKDEEQEAAIYEINAQAIQYSPESAAYQKVFGSLEAYRKASHFPYKPIENYDELDHLVGKHRQTGSFDETVLLKSDKHELNNDHPKDFAEIENQQYEHEASSFVTGSASTSKPTRAVDIESKEASFITGSSSTSKPAKKSKKMKRRAVDTVSKELRSIKAGMDAIAAALDRGNLKNFTEEQLFEEIMKVGGMSEMSRMRTYQALTRDVSAARAFLGCTRERRELWLSVNFGPTLFDA